MISPYEAISDHRAIFQPVLQKNKWTLAIAKLPLKRPQRCGLTYSYSHKKSRRDHRKYWKVFKKRLKNQEYLDKTQQQCKAHH